jgi:broad specificity phosphatase PhoE
MAIQRVYIIRHGETEWSMSGRHTGRTELALTPRGEDRARALAGRLRGVHFDHVLTSPRQRAQRTCELAGLGASAEIEPDLAEWDYGDYEGKRSAEILEARPGWNLFRDGCPHGEAPAQISARADRLIARLRAWEGTIALFSHGHFSRVFATRWIGQPVLVAQHLLLDTAGRGILDYEHHNSESPAIGLWNEGPDSG